MSAAYKVDTNGRDVTLCVRIIGKTQQEAGLADTEMCNKSGNRGCGEYKGRISVVSVMSQGPLLVEGARSLPFKLTG